MAIGLLDKLARLDPRHPSAAPATPDWRRRQAEDEALEQFLARAHAHDKVKSAADERKRRENALARTVEAIIGAELAAERARRWPDEATRERYAAHAKAFAAFARARGLGFLPAQAPTVAAFLIESAEPNGGRTLDELAAAAKAIIFAHELAHHFIDEATIAATLSFIAARHAEAEREQQLRPHPEEPEP